MICHQQATSMLWDLFSTRCPNSTGDRKQDHASGSNQLIPLV
jgi:hypothetical protein